MKAVSVERRPYNLLDIRPLKIMYTELIHHFLVDSYTPFSYFINN
jgi:hypothetical protein